MERSGLDDINVMVKPCNCTVSRVALYPAYLAICVAYGARAARTRIRLGSLVAIAGGIGLIAHPVTTHPAEHAGFALCVFASSAFWYPECTAAQFRVFCASSALFLGGFALEPASAALWGGEPMAAARCSGAARLAPASHVRRGGHLCHLGEWQNSRATKGGGA